MKYPVEQEISRIFKITREKGKLGKSTESFGKNILGVSVPLKDYILEIPDIPADWITP